MSFRSVCKSWSSLILNDSDFIKLQSTQTYASPEFLFLSGNYPDSRFYVKGADDENSDNENFDDENSDDKNSDDEEDREPELEETEPFQDWMRGVKKSKGISFYDIGKEKFKLFYSERRRIDDLNFYLVFDPATEKYKVVCIAWNYVDIVPRQTVSCMTTQYFFKILTLGTGAGSESWKDIDIPKMGFCIGGSRYKPVSVNGSLNLLCRSGRKVLCIDVSKESYHTIEYPEGASKTSKLLEIEGSLCILDYTNNSNLLDMDQHRNHLDIESMGKFTLWFLTEVGKTKKWLKKYDIDMFHNPCVAGPFKSAPVFVAGQTHQIIVNGILTVLSTFNQPLQLLQLFDGSC
ncbi:hypothetical protein MKW98_023023 [Papaver atlanticum]|uniref:F-box associated beta-propeller type 3 domain-containing protein n=1 Tax=Papaver atlanticum TaxID=357466 RepID=A0AAD4TA33_9MAGN|nr:hypothetical protein MKW98_023023 [Papaver atlanticum]